MLMKKDDRFQSRHLIVIFTVDIFNEGVDIPQVNQVIMLRPTQSAIVFVQQLGRGLERQMAKEYVVVFSGFYWKLLLQLFDSNSLVR